MLHVKSQIKWLHTNTEANPVIIADALLKRVLYQCGPPKNFISNGDKTLSADVLMYI